jgi:DNA-directed RNA polymerase subunit RPC12/RpoP
MRKATAECNLITLRPDIADLWHPTNNGDATPDMFLTKSKKKVWWRCRNGHEWQARIEHLTSGFVCPFCSGHRASKENNIASLFPEVAKHWHPFRNRGLRPQEFRPGSVKAVWWKCLRCGNEFQSPIASMTKERAIGCSVCRKRAVAENSRRLGILRSGSLASRYPKLAKEWHPNKNGSITPLDRSPGSQERVWWLCKNGHEWEALIGSRSRGTGCPQCLRMRSPKSTRSRSTPRGHRGSLRPREPPI